MGWLDSIGSSLGSLFGGGGGSDFGQVAQSAIPSSGYSLGAGGLDTSGIYGAAGGMPSFSGALDTGAGAAGGGSGGGGGWWDTAKSFGSDLGGIAKAALPAAQLGATGLGIIGGIKQMGQSADQAKVLRQEQQRQQQLAAPAAQAGASLTSAGQQAMLGGPLPQQLESQVNQYAEQLRAQYRQYLASIGQTDSTASIQLEGYINEQVANYRQQLAQGLLSSGYQGIGTAMGPSGAVTNTAAALSNPSTLAGANQAAAKLLASQQ